MCLFVKGHVTIGGTPANQTTHARTTGRITLIGPQVCVVVIILDCHHHYYHLCRQNPLHLYHDLFVIIIVIVDLVVVIQIIKIV
jgi:hypothetical protein